MSELHRLLDRFTGTWRSEGRIVDGGEHDGERWHGWDVYEWFPGERHLVHRVDVEILGARREALEIFTPRHGAPRTFDQTSFDADGSIEHALGRFEEDGTYRSGNESARATLTFDAPDAMTARWESRRADGSWGEWMTVAFTRIGEARIQVRSTHEHGG